MIVFIVEDEVVGGKRLDYSRAVGIYVIINFVLGGLGVFADTGANVACKSQNVEK